MTKSKSPKQLSLFDAPRPAPAPPPVARARATDPETSHKAAKRMNESGAALSHCDLAERALRLLGPSTSGEIAGYMRTVTKQPIVTHQVLKRMPNLKTRGLAVKLGARMCSIDESEQTVWALAGSCCTVAENHFVDASQRVKCRLCKKELGQGMGVSK